MGVVYAARDERLERTVALKIMASLDNDETARKRFWREARAAASVNHPNVCQIYEIGEDRGELFIAMELLEGESLAERLRSGPLSVSQTLPVGLGMMAALSALHARGIVHRDLKPSNVFLTPHGVKVLDFGLARPELKQSLSTATELTRTGIVMGTPRYMAPEQVNGEAVDARSDLFAAGAILFEMLSGRPAFAGRTVLEILHATLHEQPPPLTGSPALVAVDRVIRRALAKQPAERPASADAMAEELCAVRDAAGVLADAQGDFSTARGLGVPRAVASAINNPGVVAMRQGDHAATSHTVGRTKERAELVGAFDRATAGQGRLLSVSGEPGAGKTTLVEEFLAGLSASGTRCRIGRGRCSERLAGFEAYLPVLDALENLLHASGDPEVARQMEAVAPTWYAQISTATPTSGVAHTPAGSQERLKREVAALIRELSRTQPLVLFFDDVHWADASTIDLLTYLAPQFADVCVLLVVTSRPSDLLLTNHPFLSLRRDLQARRLGHELTLEMLTRDDVERYLALEFPNHRFPSELPDLIHAKTEGSPLFVADLVRYLGINGTLVQDAGGRWVVEGSLAAIGRDLPESVRGMIERKIAQLPDDDRALLTAASVQGHEFDSTVVAQVLAIDPLHVEERLEVLERVHRFVRFIEEGECPDRTVTLRYRFVHVLYQNALYAQLRATRKVTLSSTVAETLLRLHGARHQEIASELAALFEAARDFARAAEVPAVWPQSGRRNSSPRRKRWCSRDAAWRCCNRCRTAASGSTASSRSSSVSATR